ncbi:MAG: hypothetical protein RDV00_02660 [Clostridia bacterium]|nr:hypothetical protein [Clostridia bacterium]MDQ7791010.1 hypothetical protein [Clostridia bacterium]
MAGTSEYIRELLPENVEVNFIFREDFDGDGRNELVLGYSFAEPEQQAGLQFEVLCLAPCPHGFTRGLVLSTVPGADPLYGEDDEIHGVFDAAYAVDTNGDGRPELVLGLTAGNGHFVTPYVFHWTRGLPVLAWTTGEAYHHGALYVVDEDGDGVFEVVIEGSRFADEGEIISVPEAGPHLRERSVCTWDGSTYDCRTFPASPLHSAYQTALTFLWSLWKDDYETAYRLTLLPTFLGLAGLDDSSLNAFRRRVNEYLRPALVRNLEKGSLSPEPSNSFCWFEGPDDFFTLGLMADKEGVKVVSAYVNPKEVIPE